MLNMDSKDSIIIDLVENYSSLLDSCSKKNVLVNFYFEQKMGHRTEYIWFESKTAYRRMGVPRMSIYDYFEDIFSDLRKKRNSLDSEMCPLVYECLRGFLPSKPVDF